MIKEYPITFVVQEVNNDPFDESSDRVYRGVLKCKALDIEYAVTAVAYDPEVVLSEISYSIRSGSPEAWEGHTKMICDVLTDKLNDHASIQWPHLTALRSDMETLRNDVEETFLQREDKIRSLVDTHEYLYKHKTA